MSIQGVSAQLLLAWLSARSQVRGLPMPVPDHGGFRVDTGAMDEVARWIFPVVVDGLGRLARSITGSGHLIKLCGPSHDLQRELPAGWQLHARAYFMRGGGAPVRRHLAGEYRLERIRTGNVLVARIVDAAGATVANGHAVETTDAFVYDRIVTNPEHRRKGLGHVLMTTLRDAKRNVSVPELLVATQDGRALYSQMGWSTISPYSTASIAPDVAIASESLPRVQALSITKKDTLYV